MIKDYILFFKINIKIILEYKVSFIVQAITMLISNMSFILIWYFIFARFHTFGGFTFREYLIFFDTVLFNFSFMHILFGGYTGISRGATNGTLDNFLLMPRSVLLKILASGIPNSIFGDLINALIMPFFIPDFGILLFVKIVYMSFIGGLVFLGFIMITQSLSFYIGSSSQLAGAMFDLILGPGNYPEKTFDGTLFKYLFATVVPVFYTFYLPYNLSMNFEWKGFIILHLAAIFFLTIGYYTFKNGLKRYESGNLLNNNSN